MAKVEADHEGLAVRDVLRGNSPVFFSAIMNAPGKEKQRDEALDTPLATLLGETGEEPEPYVDLTITCTLKDDEEQQVLDGVPALRVHLH